MPEELGESLGEMWRGGVRMVKREIRTAAMVAGAAGGMMTGLLLGLGWIITRGVAGA